MVEKIAIADMDKEQWLLLRKSGIGGSDAGAVCGLNPYSSPMKVFQDKVGESAEIADSESIRQGRDLEQYVAERFTEATGLKVRRSNFMYRNIERPWMIANVDRLVIGEDAGLECKTASAFQADRWKDGNIPLHYLMQCYHYMAVTGKRTWYIAVVILGREFLCRKLVWDEELISSLTEAEELFWKNHVMPEIMPELDGSEACGRFLEQQFHTAERGSSIVLAGFDEKLDRREEIMEQIAVLQREQGLIEQEVKKYMAEHEFAASERYRVSWSNVDTTRLDTKRIRMEKPDIYKNYAKISSSRRFQVKAA